MHKSFHLFLRHRVKNWLDINLPPNRNVTPLLNIYPQLQPRDRVRSARALGPEEGAGKSSSARLVNRTSSLPPAAAAYSKL